jgi:hypothetical protein
LLVVRIMLVERFETVSVLSTFDIDEKLWLFVEGKRVE